MLDYKQFWEALKPAYPVSKGEIHIPIATNLEEFSVDQKTIVQELDNVMQQLFSKNDQAKIFAEEGFGKDFVSCYSGKFTGIVRFDLMFDQYGDLKIVEANTNWPDGLLMHDVTYGVLSGAKNTTHLDLFLQFFDKNDYIFILYEGVGFLDPHFLEEKLLKKMGYKVAIGTFDDLEFDGKHVFYNKNKIDVIRMSMSSARLNKDQYKLLSQIDVDFVNNFDFAGLGNKKLLEGIDSKMMMKTMKLDDGVADFVIVNKDKYVLKPSNLSEGEGVVIGVDCDIIEREKLVKRKLSENCLVQEYIAIETKSTQMYKDGAVVELMQYYDYCPHLFYRDGELIGMGYTLVRYSPNKIVNVMRGGGIGYVRSG